MFLVVSSEDAVRLDRTETEKRQLTSTGSCRPAIRRSEDQSNEPAMEQQEHRHCHLLSLSHLLLLLIPAVCFIQTETRSFSSHTHSRGFVPQAHISAVFGVFLLLFF